jgi:hypothetical protein
MRTVTARSPAGALAITKRPATPVVPATEEPAIETCAPTMPRPVSASSTRPTSRPVSTTAEVGCGGAFCATPADGATTWAAVTTDSTMAIRARIPLVERRPFMLFPIVEAAAPPVAVRGKTNQHVNGSSRAFRFPDVRVTAASHAGAAPPRSIAAAAPGAVRRPRAQAFHNNNLGDVCAPYRCNRWSELMRSAAAVKEASEAASARYPARVEGVRSMAVRPLIASGARYGSQTGWPSPAVKVRGRATPDSALTRWICPVASARVANHLPSGDQLRPCPYCCV